MAEFTYPSIEGPTFTFLNSPCVAFEKYDGSNLRFFQDQKRGWHSTGTRYRWFKLPKDFVAHFGSLPIAKVVYEGSFSRSFIDDVQSGKYPASECVVAKGVHTATAEGEGRPGSLDGENQDTFVAGRDGETSGESDELRQEFEQNQREQRIVEAESEEHVNDE